ncbi:MAG: hypothetical protein ABIJ65_05420 [Chloroflexota bacterium]
MSGITKTIPQKDGVATVEALYDGRVGEFEFHMAGKPSRLEVGDYVYTIWGDMLVGRCQITRIELGAVNPGSGKPRSLIIEKTPGEKLEKPIPHKGHRGTRYYDVAGWG